MAHTRFLVLAAFALGCASPEPEGLRLSEPGTGAEVKFDLYHRPFPDVPFPNDIATRFDASSPTRRRINASMVAATEWERATRELLDGIDGWGTFAAISVGFTKPLDVEVLFRRHQGDDYETGDDAVLVVDVTPDSPEFCDAVPLDMGEGNFPLVLERKEYFPNDPRNWTEQLIFEEAEEDVNGNGQLDPGEDTDMDGVLDHPNFRYPGADRFSAMTFYERETNSLVLKPVLPMRENTTYAVVLTRRLLDEEGRPVRSPFKWINHAAQTQALEPLVKCLPRYGLGLSDVAFTWSFTTQSISRDFRVIRDGLYGVGPMSRLATEFPPKLTRIHELKPKGTSANIKIVSGEEFRTAAMDIIPTVLGGKIDPAAQAVLDGMKFIDFHAVASFESPQFFPRNGPDDKPLPLYRQVWKVDPLTGEAFVRSETVTFWVTVPKNRNGPAPVVILGHGYTGNKLDPLVFGGFFARHGVATIGVECVSHGIGLGQAELEIARGLFKSKGLEPMFNALMRDRAQDWDNDGIKDSAADYWTAYISHVRDVVRQSAVDYMRLVQLLKSFDGAQRWEYDLNGDGTPELAGDFDADGRVDVGGSGSIHLAGASLGGIMATVMGGLEPQLDTVVPIAGGAGLGDVGVRSIQGGVGEAVNLRIMGPLLLTLRNAQGALELWQYLPDLNSLGKLRLGPMEGPEPKEGDTAVVTNLKTGEYRCGRVQANGLLRVAVSSDEGDRLKLEVYGGPLPPQKREGCRIPETSQPTLTIGSLGVEVKYQGRIYEKGSPITALGDGFGIKRGSPDLRRFMAIAQLIIDPADPVNYAPNFERRLLRYGTGEEVRTRALVVNTIGDMNVPVATGAAIARAAGFIELRKADPRYGVTPNRLLIDKGVVEAVERTGRYVNSAGKPVLMDVEHLSSVVPVDDGYDVPRLSPPLRMVGPSNRVGGYTGVLFPMSKPTGQHGFNPPDPSETWDLGSLMVNMLARYAATSGKELSFDKCQVTSSCAWIPPVPAD
ncbi:MAG: hypothetical protein HYZ28_03675 [Myxococcales bacterium]|nr:hypothetical protein [Myxococcales bacterium]